MHVKTSPQGYPVFVLDEGTESIPPEAWMTMVEGTHPAYFSAVARVPAHCQPRRIKALDCATFHNEGDECVLMLLELIDTDVKPHRLFFPIARTILPDGDAQDASSLYTRLSNMPELIAFGVETNSRFFGKRSWVAYDGLLDDEMTALLLHLFWPEEHFYALNVGGCGRGEFVFRTTLPAPHAWQNAVTRFDSERNVTIKAAPVTLTLPWDLTAPDAHSSDTQSNAAGRLEHHTVSAAPTVIGTLAASR